MNKEQETPIIIKKVHKGHGHHGGAWKVAYADFVTAMMALFIVLWILGQDEKVVQNVAGYFKDPVGFSDKMRSIIEGKSDLPSILDSAFIKKKLREEEQKQLESMGNEIINQLKETPEFENLADQVKIEIAKEGLRIEMIDSANDIFFEVGTSKLKPEAIKLLENISANLQKLPNKVVIEGHTDSRPYSGEGKGYSNFELSSERANAARRVLVLSGLPAGKVDEVRGYADTRLLDKNDPFSVVNRRISIVIKYSTEEPQ